jgi:glycine hydroxymethyltransferase
MALLQPGDKVLGFSLDQGGHLSHGHPLNFSGKLYTIIPYFVDRATERIDMDEVEAIALREKPKMILAGFSAYSRSMDWARFRAIADKVGAFLFARAARGDDHVPRAIRVGDRQVSVSGCAGRSA